VRVHNPRMIVLKFPMAPWNTMILRHRGKGRAFDPNTRGIRNFSA
jgi:hypothetical protein